MRTYLSFYEPLDKKIFFCEICRKVLKYFQKWSIMEEKRKQVIKKEIFSI